MRKLLFCLTFLIIACNNADKPAEQQVIEKKAGQDSMPGASNATNGKTIISEGGISCVRDVPQPIIKKGEFSKTSFDLQKDKQIGIETTDFENGDKLIIKNWGCDYYVLTFRFETSRFQSELTNIPFWYKRAVTLLNEVNKKMDAPIDIIKGTERLMNQIEEEVPNGYQNLLFDKELDFEEGAIRSFVSLDKVEQLTDNKFAISITFAKGPL